MSRSSVREALAGQAQVGTVKFWATRATPTPTPRRIVQYTGVGVDGAELEDLGQNARTETLQATVDEDIYAQLEVIKRAAKVVTCVHPLFGAFDGRLVDVTYDAGPDDMVNITVILIEAGDPTALWVTTINTTAGARQSADAAFANLALNDLNDHPSSTGLPSASAGMASGYSSFSAVMESVDSADGIWNDVSAAFSDLADAGNILIDAIDSFEDATQEMVDMVDTVYEVIYRAREYVDAMESQLGSVWQAVEVTAPLSLAEIALDLIGNDSDETIESILARNPTVIDICAVPIGTQLSIPVIQ